MLENDPVFATKKKQHTDQVWPDLKILKEEIARRAHFFKQEAELYLAAENGTNIPNHRGNNDATRRTLRR